MLYFDFETTNHSHGSALDQRNRILMVSWAEDDGLTSNYYGDILDAKDFWAALNRNKHVCAYAAKFEMLWLLRCGYDIDANYWHDPMLAEKVLLGNRNERMGLGYVSTRYGYSAKDPVIDSMMKAGMCPSDMPSARLKARCNRDVRTTRSVYQKQLVLLKERAQLHLHRTRCDFSVVLAHIEANGMRLDARQVSKFYETYSKGLGLVSAELDALTDGINMKSPDQKAHFLYGKLKFEERKGSNGKPMRNKPSKQFPNGRPKTDRATLVWLASKAKTTDQKAFVGLSREYSKMSAALTKNLEFFEGVCEERGGCFHAQFNQVVAATHRLTSSGLPIQFSKHDKPKSVQFQNMPREFKPCFDAPYGYLIAEVDAMQLEFRVAAFLGQDRQAMHDIADPDFDAHCRTAAVMFDYDYADFLKRYRSGDPEAKSLRTAAKPDTFKPLYGGTRGTPAQEAYYAEFNKRYAGIAAEQENWLAGVMASGEHVTAWGMHFAWDTYVNSRGVAMNKATHKPVGPQVYNYPVQNLATAEIVPIAIICLYKRCKALGLDVKFVNTIHDSVVCYVKDDPVVQQQFQEEASKAFTQDVYEHLDLFYGIDFNVPLGMEMVIGTHWGCGREYKYDDVNNGKGKVHG